MSAQRRVRSLRLAAPDERLVRRGAFLVEDALGTATLPWADAGRLVLIRSLDLGRFGAKLSPSGLALRVERRMRELASSAVHALDPAAPRSPAVFFRDAAEAHGLLAGRLARGEDASAWFWRSAVPAWHPATPRREALRTLLFSALDTPARVTAVVELVRGLGKDLEPLLEALLPEDGPALLRACGWRGMAWAGGTTGLVARWIARWGARDARSAWLAAVMKAVERPGVAADPDLPSRPSPPGPLSRSPEHALPGRGGDLREEPGPSGAAASVDEILAVTESKPLAPASEEAKAIPATIEATADVPTFQEGSTPAPVPAPAPASPRKSPPLPGRECSGDRERGPGGEGSPFAGLYFLLPVLAHLGMPRVLRDQPHLLEIDLPARVLDRLAQRLGALPEDPVRAALLLPSEVPELRGFEPPPDWPDVPWNGGDLQALLDAWIAAARRWCRRRARIGLLDLVRRPGLVAFTPTHVDVVLDLRRVDLRVRRAGLDLDPGWLPWLGRVVTFHYERLEVRHGG